MAFTIFQNLPPELRIMIWERVPRPRRLIGQVTCLDCSFITRRNYTARRRCSSQHQDWNIRVIAQPSDLPVFPPLHACRESRAVWFRRFFTPPRYINGRLRADVEASAYSIRFDIPFIDYETDIFAVFRLLDLGDIASGVLHVFENQDDEERAGEDYVDPFLGLDRSRVRHVAIGEDIETRLYSVLKLRLDLMPTLETFSVLSYGPGPKVRFDGAHMEMWPPEIQLLRCEILDLPDLAIQKHPLLNAARFRHRRFEPRPTARPLKCYLRILKLALWHVEKFPPKSRFPLASDPFEEENFALAGWVRGVVAPPECPFQGSFGCGKVDHTMVDIENWTPRFRMRCLMLVDKAGWLDQSVMDRSEEMMRAHSLRNRV